MPSIDVDFKRAQYKAVYSALYKIGFYVAVFVWL